jgi:hypothetical protein
MKTALILLLFVASSVSTELTELRKMYSKAGLNKENAETFYKKTAAINSDDPIILGYKGFSLTLKAKYASEILKKKNYFTEGVETLESSIKKAPENVELRVLRMSIQENTPRFLNYNKNIAEDKQLILTGFSKSKSEVKTIAIQFISSSKLFSEKELKTVGL